MKPDDLLCYCFHITKRKVTNFVRLHKPRRVSQLSECGGAGTGCGWCVPYLERCFKVGIEGDETPFNADEYATARANYIKSGKSNLKKPPTSPDTETP